MIRNIPGFLALVLILHGCASSQPEPSQTATAPWQPPLDSHCRSGDVLLDRHFDGGRLGDCQVDEAGTFILTHYPEDAPPINPSPWYAFRVSGKAGDEVNIRLRYADAWARYWPKISSDGEQWTSMDDSLVERTDDGGAMDIHLTLTQPLTWVAGGELLTGDWYAQWLRELAAQPNVNVALLGQSRLGRPLFLAATEPRKELVVMIGRQHPPEVTGALAMHAFVTTVLSDSELSRAFLERYQVAIVPMVNPDGVARGHWRHNTDGVDLNRDWGPFTQPETHAIRDWVAGALADGRRLRLQLDFHSTRKNVFYTQRDDIHPTDPPGFTLAWLAAGRARLPDYDFVREAAENIDQANSKNWFYKTYGIPAITYETGDETSRQALAAAAVVFAEEMMKLLLEAD